MQTVKANGGRSLATLGMTNLRKRRIADANHINFAGNDYLGLSQDRRVKDAFIAGVEEYGFGSSSSPLICGYSRAHQQLEETFAEYAGRERALFFNSGYHANLGVITAMANKKHTIIADKHCHASIIDAITLSRASYFRYHHQDLDHAESLLQQYQQPLLISESVFSMSGAITDISKLSSLAKQNHALLMIDDAHGFGILDKHANDISILVTPFGKALGGIGACVSGSNELIEFILQKARTYCYSTALPPAVCSAAITALHIMQSEAWRITRLRELIQHFHTEAAARNISLISSDLTPIKCILSGSNEQTLALQEKLLAHNIFVAAIRPPTVPKDSARLRISLNISHSEADITRLLELLCTT